jgi:pyridinium-3,5-biscarboxylic acid mononucleotide sulfurtransferase
MDDRLAALEAWLRQPDSVAVAVSGGVDSMTLAAFAHRTRHGATTMFHAVSPAVPPEATERVRRYARYEEWDLQVFDAGEFGDTKYLANPVNRCFHCKTHLYGAIANRTSATLLSGTNIDDLGDFRPGLAAARTFDVRHPFVEVGIDKSAIRSIASGLGLSDVAELPAAPCLASRVETGIVIVPADLTAVNRVERALGQLLRPTAVRCRLRADRIEVELDEATLDAVSTSGRQEVLDLVRTIWADHRDRPVTLATYRRGSAFLREGMGPAALSGSDLGGRSRG